MKKFIWMVVSLVVVIFGLFVIHDSADAASNGIIVSESVIGESGADQHLLVGKDIKVSCLISRKGYWGWAFINAHTEILEGKELVSETQTIVRVKNRHTNKVLFETKGGQLGWSVHTYVSRYFYDTPENPDDYYVETVHKIQVKDTKKWYLFVQKKDLLYSKNYFYWNSQVFA